MDGNNQGVIAPPTSKDEVARAAALRAERSSSDAVVVANTSEQKASSAITRIDATEREVYRETRTTITSAWELGGLSSGGAETVASDRYRTGFISVAGLKSVALEGNLKMYRINVYGANMVHIRQISTETTVYTVEPDAGVIRILRMVAMDKDNVPVYGHIAESLGKRSVYQTTAATFDFLPGNSARANTIALQAAVDRGGKVSVTIPGIYDLDASIKIGDDTSLEFGAGVFIRRTTSDGYVFVNKGAYTRTYNKNINIKGLRLICNGNESRNGPDMIVGLRGQVSFFYVRDLVIEDFQCFDLMSYSYCIHICTFENIRVDNHRVEGDKDAVHLGKGKGFIIRNGWYKTYDDPIALNGHDYDTGNPQLGWIENGLIENCYDLAAPNTTGYFARILAGAWINWTAGMEVQKSDTVVNNGRLYRVVANSDGVKYTSNTAPTHTAGTATLDGIKWVMVQDDDPTYTAGCRNITFRNIYLQKNRPTGFSIHFDKDSYSRSYYPNAVTPIQTGLVFDNLFVQGNVPTLIGSIAPVGTVKIINSELPETKINLNNVNTEGITYNKTSLLLSGNTYKSTKSYQLVNTATGRSADVKITGSIVENAAHKATFSAGVTVLANDLE